jgi:uncharacterized protein DUF6496
LHDIQFRRLSIKDPSNCGNAPRRTAQNSDSTLVSAPTFFSLECAQHTHQSIHPEETAMAGKYSRGAQRKVKKVMKERKSGTLKSGRSGKKVKSRKQAIAIGLSEARRAGKKVPKKKSARGSH